MRPFVLPLLGVLALVGCPQERKTTSGPPRKTKSATAKTAPAKTAPVKTAQKANETAKLPQVTYYAFKG